MFRVSEREAAELFRRVCADTSRLRPLTDLPLFTAANANQNPIQRECVTSRQIARESHATRVDGSFQRRFLTSFVRDKVFARSYIPSVRRTANTHPEALFKSKGSEQAVCCQRSSDVSPCKSHFLIKTSFPSQSHRCASAYFIFPARASLMLFAEQQQFAF